MLVISYVLRLPVPWLGAFCTFNIRCIRNLKLTKFLKLYATRFKTLSLLFISKGVFNISLAKNTASFLLAIQQSRLGPFQFYLNKHMNTWKEVHW